MRDSEEWRPLDVREGWRTERGPYEGVPQWMRASLLEWLRDAFYKEWRTGAGRRAQTSFNERRLRRAERLLTWESPVPESDIDTDRQKIRRLIGGVRDAPELMLKLADFALMDTHPATSHDPSPGQLHTILLESGSVWQVADKGEAPPHLERRVQPELEEVATGEIQTGDKPGDLLAEAWAETFGVEPDPSEGYRHAVRAVEAAAGPVVLPNDEMRTLGRAIGTMDAARHKWGFVLPDRKDDEPSIQTIIDMMGTLWTSQYDRHVTEGAPLYIEQFEADAAVPMAALLVRWFRTGAVGRSE